MILLEGDFSDAIEPLVPDPSESVYYNLPKHNCSQRTLGILAKCDTEYKNDLLRASEVFFPRAALYQLKDDVLNTKNKNSRNRNRMIGYIKAMVMEVCK